jgi:hypothetical protein
MKKVIHLIRDGRDVITSYYHMLRNQGYQMSLDQMIVKDEGVYPTDWSTHCEAWCENPYQAEILKIRYEDLKAIPIECLESICNFLNIHTDTSFLKQTIEHCSFKNLQNKEIETKELTEVMKSGNFFRKGEIGSYKGELNENQICIFESRHGTMLNKLGYL